MEMKFYWSLHIIHAVIIIMIVIRCYGGYGGPVGADAFGQPCAVVIIGNCSPDVFIRYRLAVGIHGFSNGIPLCGIVFFYVHF